MQGEGKRRSEWNNLLLRDVIGPIYAALVARARDVSDRANSDPDYILALIFVHRQNTIDCTH